MRKRSVYYIVGRLTIVPDPSPMFGSENSTKSLLQHLIDVGSEITGSAGGAGIGLLVGGPGGAVAGGAAAPALVYMVRKVATEIGSRVLGPREEVRIGAVLTFAAAKVQEKIAAGQRPRDDEFFHPLHERTSGEEILEGVLLTAQREHEERKIPFYANLLANIVFRTDIDRFQANLLIRTAQRLSYRQLCLLTLFSVSTPLILRAQMYSGEIPDNVVSVLQEIYDLYLQSLVQCSSHGLLHLGQIVPAKMNAWGTGEILVHLMELNSISSVDLERSAELLSY